MGKDSFLPPWVIQVFGGLIIGVFVIVKIKTGAESSLLVGVGATFVVGGTGMGVYSRAKQQLYKGEPPSLQPGEQQSLHDDSIGKRQ